MICFIKTRRFNGIVSYVSRHCRLAQVWPLAFGLRDLLGDGGGLETACLKAVAEVTGTQEFLVLELVVLCV
jgi:hypothetical protein